MERWQTFLIVLAGITALIAFIRKVVKPAIRWVKRWDTMFREFVPDSGKSMKDQVTNMEIMVGATKSTLAAMIKFDNLAVIECNGGGRCVMVNKSWTALSGLDLGNSQGWGWLNAIQAQDIEKAKNEWVSALGANSEFNKSYKFVNRITHDIFNVECIGVINRNAKLEVISIVLTFIRLQEDAPVKEDKSTPL